MGGSITVQSEYGKGSTFTITLPQKFEEYVPFAKVNAPEEKRVLLYAAQSLHRNSIEQAFKDLGVAYVCAGNADALSYNLEEYSYVFIDSLMYNRIHQALQKLHNPPELIVLSDITEMQAYKATKVLALPAYSLPIANILNDVYEERDGMPVTKESFTAPDVNVLVVDDIISNLMVAKGLMAPYEMNITTCTSGAEALRLIANNRYDLVFMDHMMPSMDGIEATGYIRAMEGEYFASVPIIALTANAVSGVREMFIQHGMNDFLAKPIEITKLNAILEKWVPVNKRNKAKAAEEPAQQLDADSTFLDMLKTVPELSANKAIAVMGGSAETYEEILKISVRLLPENITRLGGFLHTDPKNYSIEVHGIKGVLNNIGAYELGKSAYELEELSKRGDMEACARLHPGFTARLTGFLDSVLAIIGEPEVSGNVEGDLSALRADLPRLENAVEFFDAADALEMLSSISQYTYGQETDAALARLRHALECFDFDEAAESLKQLKGVLEANE